MNNTSRNKNQDVASFYNVLASEYDAMTTFNKRFIYEKPFFRILVERYGLKTAIDAGCGTGFHSLLLAQLGVEVTAIDLSSEMLKCTRNHARKMKVKVTTVQSSFENLSTKIRHKVDAVFCMGNSLSHLLSKQNLRQAINNFAAVLRQGGILFLQNLNYDRILAQRDRIQSIKATDNKIFVRFYDYEADRIQFNILTIRKEEGALHHQLSSVLLRPLFSDSLIDLLREKEFNKIRIYGNIEMEPYNSEKSHDLIILAHRI